MRAYFFVNSALSGIQKGLQVAHCAVEIGIKAKRFVQPTSKIQELAMGRRITYWNTWSESHKTIIVLEGGFHQDLLDISDLFDDIIHDYPWAEFREDEETLALSYTAVGIILPERIYKAAEEVRKYRVHLDHASPDTRVHEFIDEFNIGEWEAELINLMNSKPLAR